MGCRGSVVGAALFVCTWWCLQSELALLRFRELFPNVLVITGDATGLPSDAFVSFTVSGGVAAEGLWDPDFGLTSSVGLLLERESQVCLLAAPRVTCGPKVALRWWAEFVWVMVARAVHVVASPVLSFTELVGLTWNFYLDWPGELDCKASGPKEERWLRAEDVHLSASVPPTWMPLSRKFLPDAVSASGFRLAGNLIRVKGNTSATALVFGDEDCLSAKWTREGEQGVSCRVWEPRAIDGYVYQGDAWFLAQADARGNPGSGECNLGDVRIRFLVHDPPLITVVGQVAQGTVGVLRRNGHDVGFLEEGRQSIRELCEGDRGKVLGCAWPDFRRARAYLLAVGVVAMVMSARSGKPRTWNECGAGICQVLATFYMAWFVESRVHTARPYSGVPLFLVALAEALVLLLQRYRVLSVRLASLPAILAAVLLLRKESDGLLGWGLPDWVIVVVVLLLVGIVARLGGEETAVQTEEVEEVSASPSPTSNSRGSPKPGQVRQGVVLGFGVAAALGVGGLRQGRLRHLLRGKASKD